MGQNSHLRSHQNAVKWDVAKDKKPAYVWDYDLDEVDFLAILDGKITKGRLDSDWAAVRLLEYGSYADFLRLMGFKRLLSGWSKWRDRVRSQSRRRGFDFLTEWLPRHHPEYLS